VKKYLIAMLALAATSAFAADTADELFSAAQLAAQDAQLLEKAAKDPSGAAGTTFGSYGNHNIQYNARTKSGSAEIHGHWVDVFYITGGTASIVMGGTVPDAQPGQAEGESRGTTIVGGHERKVAKGDVVHIPANTPHQFVLAPGQSVTFLVVKVAQP